MSSAGCRRTIADVLIGCPTAKSKKPKTLDPHHRDDDGDELLKKKGSDFIPRSAATWKDGEPVPFLFLARALDLIANESGRLVITEILANVFRTVMATTPEDLLPTVYLSANRFAPTHEGIDLGIEDESLIKALAEAYGREDEHIKKQLKDLGLVAKASSSSQRTMGQPHQQLTIVEVLGIWRR